MSKPVPVEFRPISETALRAIVGVMGPTAVAKQAIDHCEEIRGRGGDPVCMKGPDSYVVLDAVATVKGDADRGIQLAI